MSADPYNLISVIIPAHNSGIYITQAIDSVLEQDHDNIQIVVVDDGSSDETRDLLEPYQSKIQYIWQENAGVSAARNKGLANSLGKLIVFLDADDYFLPGKLKRQFEAFQSRPDLDIVHSGWQIVDEDGNLIAQRTPWLQAPYLDLESFLLWKPIFPAAFMFRKGSLDRIGGFTPGLAQAEDVDLVLRMMLHGAKAIWLPEVTACYRQHPLSAMQNGSQQVEALELVLRRFFSNELPPSVRKLESLVWLNSLLWMAWHLYHSNGRDQVATYIQNAQRYSKIQPGTPLSVLYWQYKFSLLASESGRRIGQVQSFWPHFKEASGIDNSGWENVEAAMGFWLRVWRHYWRPNELEAIRGLREYADIPLQRILKLAIQGIFITPNGDLEKIRRFEEDLRLLKPDRQNGLGLMAAAYLAFATRALLKGSVRACLRGIFQAFRTGLSFTALQTWFAVIVRPGIRNVSWLLVRSSQIDGEP